MSVRSRRPGGPYPSIYNRPRWLYATGIGTVVLGMALLGSGHVVLGAVLACAPEVLFVADATLRAPRLRRQALDTLEQRASRLSAAEVDGELRALGRYYGGYGQPSFKRRAAAIRALARSRD